jgi:hypothetical protein
MKISELLNEASKGADYSAVIDQLEQTPEFKDFSKYFDLNSTKIQRKNGSLQIVTKDTYLKEPREYFVNYAGDIKVKNSYASIWGKAGYGAGPDGSLQMYLNCLDTIHTHFVNWFAKRLKNAKDDVRNLSLTTLKGRIYPNKISNFNCSYNNLTTLEGAPELNAAGDFSVGGDFYCNNNELTSPLVGGPEQCRLFNAANNKLTSFEGFPKHAQFIQAYGNPITSFSDVHKHIPRCQGFNLPPVKTGVLAFFKVKDCTSIAFTINGRKTEDGEFGLVAQIVSKHLFSSERSAIKCQRELIENDLDDYAEF